MNGERKVTSVKIDEKLWKEAKHYAIDKGVTVTELVESGLRKEMKESTLEEDEQLLEMFGTAYNNLTKLTKTEPDIMLQLKQKYDEMKRKVAERRKKA